MQTSIHTGVDDQVSSSSDGSLKFGESFVSQFEEKS